MARLSAMPGQEAKESGNAAFKSGHYAEAIGHYSRAIHADPRDASFRSNRAFAYLKLEKYEDAQRDASAALALDPTPSLRSKLLFRRAVARRQLGRFDEARQDLDAARDIEPTNASIDAELAQLHTAIEQADEAQAKRRERVKTLQTAAPNLRPAVSAPSEPELMQAVSTRRLNEQSAKPAVISGPSAPASSYANLRSTRESKRQPYQLPRSTSDTAQPPSRPRVAPTTALEFEQRWHESVEERDDLLRSVEPLRLPTVFGASLSPELLSGIIARLRGWPQEDARPYARALEAIPRFDFVSLLLMDEELDALQSLTT
ncbi:uncharacterized protein L969DRAFT_50656 [Mixia osmundae IAM 14324]|uniref:RNA polymerase II-associated protein 3 n=1 Tax=Mixia osmundae (strain CBS 9802 / IAM 14324 / JCM 22182 / KY 12970) TaxID=764103 RepID=G7DZ13_MIXOS|nr:uncharacterized protein L969DRAFT_50656 [Mixia osmundae IAM 14324]KEI38225.1 hypothetical protein L969DRAFT_50656 [Mixia osmundae IAM 14324]GAA95823.1 hypothetical protein E5Q_02480 [Mixia osmundae IAM 14324]